VRAVVSRRFHFTDVHACKGAETCTATVRYALETPDTQADMGLISVNSNVQVPSPAPCDVSGPRWQVSRDIADFGHSLKIISGWVCVPRFVIVASSFAAVSPQKVTECGACPHNGMEIAPRTLLCSCREGEHRVLCLYERRRVRIVCEDRQDESPT
jgi:hypothetical protein